MPRRAARGSLLTAEEMRAARERNRAADAKKAELAAVATLGLAMYSDSEDSSSADEGATAAEPPQSTSDPPMPSAAVGEPASSSAPPGGGCNFDSVGEGNADLAALVDALEGEIGVESLLCVDDPESGALFASEQEAQARHRGLYARLTPTGDRDAADTVLGARIERLRGEMDARFADWSIGALPTTVFLGRLALMVLRVDAVVGVPTSAASPGSVATVAPVPEAAVEGNERAANECVLPLSLPPLVPNWAAASVDAGAAETSAEASAARDAHRECLLFACAATRRGRCAPATRLAIALLTRAGGQRRCTQLRASAQDSSSASAVEAAWNYFVVQFAGRTLAGEVFTALASQCEPAGGNRASRRGDSSGIAADSDCQWRRIGHSIVLRRMSRHDPPTLLGEPVDSSSAADSSGSGSSAAASNAFVLFTEDFAPGASPNAAMTRASTTLSQIECAQMPSADAVRRVREALARTKLREDLGSDADAAAGPVVHTAAAAAVNGGAPVSLSTATGAAGGGKRARSAGAGSTRAGAKKRKASSKARASGKLKSKLKLSSGSSSGGAAMPKQLASMQAKWRAAAAIAKQEDAPRTLADIEAAEAAVFAEWEAQQRDVAAALDRSGHPAGDAAVASSNPNFAPLGTGGSGTAAPL